MDFKHAPRLWTQAKQTDAGPERLQTCQPNRERKSSAVLLLCLTALLATPSISAEDLGYDANKYCSDTFGDKAAILENECRKFERTERTRWLERQAEPSERAMKTCSRFSRGSYMLLNACIDAEIEAERDLSN